MTAARPERGTGSEPAAAREDRTAGEVGTSSLLPDQTSDDVDADWRDGPDRAGHEAGDDARLLEDRPPHWD